jgi:predicted nuclease of predicted toxin-antitoxin system
VTLPLRFFVDECLSPSLAHRLANDGLDAVCARDMGRSGDSDHAILSRCLDEDRVLVTHNAEDFRQLVGRSELHPGLIILDESSRERSMQQLRAALDYVRESASPEPRTWMVNRVVEVGTDGAVATYELPPQAQSGKTE